MMYLSFFAESLVWTTRKSKSCNQSSKAKSELKGQILGPGWKQMAGVQMPN